MRPEILSTARPSRLRLLGFLCLVAGALLAGIGAALTWATVGFPNDAAHVADVAVKGIDVWEGIVVLAIAAAALVVLIVTRVVGSPVVRTVLSIGLALGGAVAVGLAVLDLATAKDRFGGGGEIDRIATKMAAVLGQPVDAVRALLEKNFGAALRVEVGPGPWMALAGGLLLVLAGALSLAWTRERARAADVSEPVAEDPSPDPPAADAPA
jgi:hypothetical protein